MPNNNKGLNKAQVGKNDEFYTRYEDIEKEVSHYAKEFSGKTVYCNCDNPLVSNFFRYFADNFTSLGLGRLICTCYSPLADIVNEGLFDNLFEDKITNSNEHAYKVDIRAGDEIISGNIYATIQEEASSGEYKHISILQGSGDFASPECVSLLHEADIIVSNPPFSLFTKYMELILNAGKKYLIVGNQNAITAPPVFRAFKNNELWNGYGFKGNAAFFTSPYEDTAASNSHMAGHIRVPGIVWYTNMDTELRHQKLPLTQTYSEELYPKYDNYDAIHIDKVKNIPKDYRGFMGVPISFSTKYCPEQFEVVDLIVPKLDGETKFRRIIIKAR